MRHILKVSIVLAILATQQAMADDDKSCKMVAKACTDAGFVKEQSATKGIWDKCMKQVLLGQTVKGVKVDAEVVKSCRESRIKEMQDMIEQFKQVK